MWGPLMEGFDALTAEERRRGDFVNIQDAAF